MSMIHEGDNQYEDNGQPVLDAIDAVLRKHGNKVLRVGRWALVREQIFVTARTPKAPKKPKAPKSKGPLRPPPRPGEDPAAGESPEAEPEQAAEQLKKPPQLAVLKWIKPPASVQVYLRGKKLGTGLAHFLEYRTDLWCMMSELDREAAVMTKLLERDVVDTEEGDVKVRRVDLPVQTHPAVVAAYGPWWERMDPELALDAGADTL